MVARLRRLPPANVRHAPGVPMNCAIRWWMSDFAVDVDREDDGRWIADVGELPGVMVYGASREEAVAKAKVLAVRVLAERREHGE